MKCQYCNKEVELKEVKTTKYINCCGDIQVDLVSLRPKVQAYLKKEKEFFNNLGFILR